MKKYIKTYSDKCIGCHACESACSTLYFKEDNATKSCIRITMKDPAMDMNVCNQCQVCVQVCPTQALFVNQQGVVILNKTLCINCLMCIGACPTNSMLHFKDGLYPLKCIACGFCIKSCPVEAIAIVQE